MKKIIIQKSQTSQLTIPRQTCILFSGAPGRIMGQHKKIMVHLIMYIVWFRTVRQRPSNTYHITSPNCIKSRNRGDMLNEMMYMLQHVYHGLQESGHGCKILCVQNFHSGDKKFDVIL